MARMILIPIGSSGDVHPLLGLGTRLQHRGHAVTVITNPEFEPLVQKLGFDFHPLGTVEEFQEVAGNPDLWQPWKGFKMVARWAMLATMEQIYDYLEELYQPGETAVAAPATALGARVAQEKLGLPLATIHLQPAVFRSVYQSAVLPPLLMGAGVPKILKRIQFYLADRLLADPILAGETNAFRAARGLPPVSRILDIWWNSPMRIVGLFPDWYAPRQPDWPAQTVLTGFPLWDESETTAVPEDLRTFMDAGTPPLVFTPGSAMQHGVEFFAVAVDVCQRLDRRGILLTRHAEQIPAQLPDTIAHFDYVPFSVLLPQSAALVHHGGIGSTAQALSAGIPQLIMAMAHDQPDNAARIERLGVGRGLQTKQFRAPRVAALMDQLLSSRDVATQCGRVQQRFDGMPSLDDAALEIEKLIGNES